MADDRPDSPDFRLVAVIRSIGDDDARREAPPADLWQRIASDPRVNADAQSTATDGDGAGPSGAGGGRGSVAPLRRKPMVAMVAALAVAASIIAALVLTGRSNDTDRVLASAPLSNSGLASFAVTPSGQAELISSHGHTYLQLTLRDAPAESGAFLEVWLIDRTIHGMVSLGPYAGNGRYLVPGAVETSQFPVVDVSVQHADGVPTHSGISVVRGTLPAVGH